MIFNRFMENVARETGGQFSAYDKSKSVIIIPLQEDRFQTIVGMLRLNDTFEREIICFSTKVCNLQPGISLEELLNANNTFCHARFVIEDNVLKVEAATFPEHATEALLKEIIMEVAHVADEWEQALTGLDRF